MAKQANHFAITYVQIHLVRPAVGFIKIQCTRYEHGCVSLPTRLQDMKFHSFIHQSCIPFNTFTIQQLIYKILHKEVTI